MHAFCNNPFVPQHAGGQLSPMFDVEPQFFSIIVNISKICQRISSTQGFWLAKSLMEGKPIETKLNNDKEHNSFTSGNTGWGTNGATLGVDYWRGFMACNSHLIESKSSQKFSVEISNWSTYQNYNQMYEHMYNEMVEAGVARKLDVPVWMNENGEVFKKKRYMFGKKITHQMILGGPPQ